MARALLTGCYARVVKSVRDFTGDLMNLFVYGILLVVGCILFCTDMITFAVDWAVDIWNQSVSFSRQL